MALPPGPSKQAIADYLATATMRAGSIGADAPQTLTQTWNNAGVTFTAWKTNITDTTSAAGSFLFDFQVGGASRFAVTKAGNLTLGSSNATWTNVVLRLESGTLFGWSGRGFLSAAADGVFTWTDNAQTSFGRLQFGGTTAAFPAIGLTTVSGGWGIKFPSAADTNGQTVGIEYVTELTTIAAAATTDTAIQIPANAIVLAVSVRVTVVIPTAATFTVIGTTTSTAFQTGATVSAAATTTDAGTKACPYLNATAQTIRITPNAQPADTTGRVRVTIAYIKSTPPTS